MLRKEVNERKERAALCRELKVKGIFIHSKEAKKKEKKKKSYINIFPDVIFSARTHFPVEIIREEEIV